MYLMTRSAKNKQRQAEQMRSTMQAGSGVRTIGGMYALVKSVSDEAVQLEIAPGMFATYAKNAVAAVLDPAEYDRIVHGTPESAGLAPAAGDAADATAEQGTTPAGTPAVDLGKPAAEPVAESAAPEPAAAPDRAADREEAGGEGPAAK